MEQLFFCNEDKSYYLVCPEDINIFCTTCRKIIEMGKFVFIHKSFSKKEYVKSYYCQNCLKRIIKRIYDEMQVAKISSIVPENAIIVAENAPSLKVSTDCFDAALSNKNITSDTTSTKTINKCKVAFDPNRNKEVDFEEKQDRIEQREKELNRKVLNDDELDNFFEDIKESKQVEGNTRIKIVHKKKKK